MSFIQKRDTREQIHLVFRGLIVPVYSTQNY